MKTTTLNYPNTSLGNQLVSIAHSKILGEKKDYFLHYKYDAIRSYYGPKCLDIGAGNGSYSEFLRDHGHEVSSLDVVDKSKDGLKQGIQLFNGQDIPFENNSYDTSMLLFVLHHTDVQKELLRDCMRVTKNYIIVAEDIIQNQFDAWMGAIHLNTSPWSKGFNSFKDHRGWLHFFAQQDLEIVEVISIPRWVYPVYPVSRKIYVLKVPK